jgi:hypothetical protein
MMIESSQQIFWWNESYSLRMLYLHLFFFINIDLLVALVHLFLTHHRDFILVVFLALEISFKILYLSTDTYNFTSDIRITKYSTRTFL